MLLSIVVTFCDKDVKYINNLLKSIKEKVHVSHEVILIDNREKDKSELELINATVYSKGYNAYQFEARRFAVQYCKGDYIWYFDADDVVFEVNSDLEDKFTEDIVVFNYAIKQNVVILPYNWEYLKAAFNRKRFSTIKTEDVLPLCPNNDVWDLYTCVLWNKWIKRTIMESIVPLIPKDKIVVASEDVLYCALAIEKSDTVCFCDDAIYMYNELLSSGVCCYMTTERFMHIITGFDISRNLFNTLFKDPSIYNDLNYNAAYFLSKLLYCDDIDICMDKLLQFFSKEEITKCLNHPWLLNCKPENKEKLEMIKKKYL